MSAGTHANGTHADLDRLPPHNRAAERWLIATMLRDNACIQAVLAVLRPDEFYVYAHQRIVEAIAKLDGDGAGADLVTVATLLTQAKLINEIGGHAYLADLYADAPAAANIKAWAEEVSAAAAKRSLLHATTETASQAGDPTIEPGELIAAAIERLEEIRRPSGKVERFSVGQLIDEYPHLHPPVIDGLFREREIVNVISTSKIGKSWLAYGMILTLATGRLWLDRFTTSQGRVLLIDNELHRATLARRIVTVGEALEIQQGEYRNTVEVWPLRGNLRDIHAIGRDLRRAKGFKLIVFDAKYRMAPVGKSENENGAETEFYNLLDAYAEQTGAAMLNIGHASKGSQAEKRVTDVGAGAGAQSRAADSHIILREHEDNGVVVLDGALRSFAPLEPLPLRWTFPLWLPDGDIDPSKLRGRLTVQDERQKQKDAEAIGKIIDRLMIGPAPLSALRELFGSRDRAPRLLAMLEKEGRVQWTEIEIRGNKTREYRLKK